MPERLRSRPRWSWWSGWRPSSGATRWRCWPRTTPGRELAAGIPGARFVGLPGRCHLAYGAGADALADEVGRFLTGDPAGRPGPDEAGLSPRELEVVRMVALGLTNAEIGWRLGIRH